MENQIAISRRDKEVQVFSTSPTKYFDSVGHYATSIRAVLDNDFLSLRKLKCLDEVRLNALIVDAIGQLLTHYGFRKEDVDQYAVAGLVRSIIDTYYYFSLGDIYLFLRYAKSGKYGKMYGRLDMSQLMAWMTEYDAERASTVVPQEKKVEFYGDEITEDEYLAMLKEKVEKGDEEAKKLLEAFTKRKAWQQKMKEETRLYNEHKIHKFDKQRIEDEWKFQQLKQNENGHY